MVLPAAAAIGSSATSGFSTAGAIALESAAGQANMMDQTAASIASAKAASDQAVMNIHMNSTRTLLNNQINMALEITSDAQSQVKNSREKLSSSASA